MYNKFFIGLIILIVFCQGLYSQENFGLTPVNRLNNRWFDDLKGISVSDNYILLNTSRNIMQLLNCSNLDSIYEIGGFDLGELDVNQYKKLYGNLFVAHPDGLRIINITRAPSVTIRSNFRYESGILALELVDDHAYLITGDDRLLILDINDINHPEQLSLTNLEMTPVNLRIHEETCYIVGDQFITVDVSDPENPQVLWRTDEIALDVELINQNAAIALGDSGMKVYRMTDPSNPDELLQFDCTSYQFNKIGDFLFSAYHIYEYYDDWREQYIEAPYTNIYDFSNPVSPNYSQQIYGDARNVMLTSQNRLIISAEDSWGTTVIGCFTFTDEGQITHESTLYNPPYYQYLVTFPGFIAATYGRYLYTYEQPDLSGLQEVSKLDLGRPQDGNYKNFILYHNDEHNENLYYFSAPKIGQIEMGDPTRPSLYDSSFAFSGHSTGLTIDGDYLYTGISDAENSGLAILPIPEGNINPAVSSMLEIEADINSKPAVYGDYAYIAARNDGFFIIDISDKDNPREVAQIESRRESYDLDVENGFLYVADGNLNIYDLDIPEQPQVIYEFDPPDTVYHVSIRGGHAFLYTGHPNVRKALMILDVSDPENPVITGYQNAPYIKDSSIDSNLLYLLDAASLGIFDISEAMTVRDEYSTSPQEFMLIDPAYPNPFNSSTSVNVRLTTSSRVSIGLYDIGGRKISNVVSDMLMQAGSNIVTINGETLPSGYFYIRFEANDGIYSQPLIHIK